MEGHQQRGDCQVGDADGLGQDPFGDISQDHNAHPGGQGDMDAGGVEELFEFGHGRYYFAGAFCFTPELIINTFVK